MLLDRYGFAFKNYPEHIYHTGRLFMPNSKLFATCQDYPVGRLVTDRSLEPAAFARAVKGHSGKVWCVAASPEGTILATGSNDNSIQLWTARGDHITALPEHTEKVQCLAFSPDGSILASGSADKTIRLWDLSTLECTHVLRGHDGRVSSVLFTLDGHIVSGSWDKTVKIWRADTEGAIDTLSIGKEVFSVSVSPDDGFIAIGAAKLLTLYDRRTQSKPRSLGHISSSVFSVAFSPSGDVLVAGMKDGSVRSWDLSSGETQAHAGERSSLRHLQEVTSVAWSSDSMRVFSASRDKSVHVHDVLEFGRLKGRANTRGFTSPLQDLLLVPHAPHSRLVAVGEDGGLTIWDEEVFDVSSASSEAVDIAMLAFSPDGALLATSSSSGAVIIRDAANGVTMSTLHGSGVTPRDIVFSEDGAELFLGYDDSSESTWTAGIDFPMTSRETGPLPDTLAEDDVVFTPDDNGWIYICHPLLLDRYRLCWIPLDRRWSNWFTQVAWAGTKIAIGNDEGVLTIIDFPDISPLRST
jgi:WD40 repeat protein